MASIQCSNGHVHTSVEDVKRCYGLASAPAATVPASSGHPATAPGVPVTYASPRQLSFIADLGGDPLLCRGYTHSEASKVIDNLLVAKGRKARMTEAAPAPTPAPTPEPDQPWKSTTETKVFLPMLDSLPDGYYAWTPDIDANVTFLRVKRYPSSAKNRFAGSVLVQTQHSDELLPAWVLWPSKRISRYRNGRNNFDIETVINALIVDYRACAMRYAQLKGNCCICNKELTDPRSRHYGIGPDCEKTHGWVITEVDENNDGVPWERLADSK